MWCKGTKIYSSVTFLSKFAVVICHPSKLLWVCAKKSKKNPKEIRIPNFLPDWSWINSITSHYSEKANTTSYQQSHCFFKDTSFCFLVFLSQILPIHYMLINWKSFPCWMFNFGPKCSKIVGVHSNSSVSVFWTYNLLFRPTTIRAENENPSLEYCWDNKGNYIRPRWASNWTGSSINRKLPHCA